MTFLSTAAYKEVPQYHRCCVFEETDTNTETCRHEIRVFQWTHVSPAEAGQHLKSATDRKGKQTDRLRDRQQWSNPYVSVCRRHKKMTKKKLSPILLENILHKVLRLLYNKYFWWTIWCIGIFYCLWYVEI